MALAAVSIAGCGSDDDEPARGTGASSLSADRAVLRSPALGFTFEYPKGLAATERSKGSKRRARVLAQVSVAENGRFNSIKIRKTADREFGPERYVKGFQRAFAADADGEVDTRQATVGDLETAIIEFDDSVNHRDPPVEFRSTSYFFTGGGKTWQMECIAEPEHREEVADICRGALESVEFRRTKRPGRRRAKG